jgi:hypothetical protein
MGAKRGPQLEVRSSLDEQAGNPRLLAVTGPVQSMAGKCRITVRMGAAVQEQFHDCPMSLDGRQFQWRAIWLWAGLLLRAGRERIRFGAAVQQTLHRLSIPRP